MSPDTDPHDHTGADSAGADSARADSAGVPWEGRRFESNRHSDDDGSADPALLAALGQPDRYEALLDLPPAERAAALLTGPGAPPLEPAAAALAERLLAVDLTVDLTVEQAVDPA